MGHVPDPLAALLCIIYSLLLGLGVKCSATVNSFLTLINLIVMALVIGLGIYHADLKNWSSENYSFMPYGFHGVLAGKYLFKKKKN